MRPRSLNLLFFCFVILPSLFLYAQESTKFIKGKIILNADPKEKLTPRDVLIQNITRDHEVFSDANGIFSIAAAIDDSILVKSQEFYLRKFKINHRVWNKKIWLIHLTEEVIELESAEFSSFPYSGYLEEDIKKNTNEKDETQELYGKLGLNPSVLDLVFFSELGPNDYWAVFPKAKNLDKVVLREVMKNEEKKRLKEFKITNIRSQAIREYFGDDFFGGELQINVKQIPFFLNFVSAKTNLNQAFDRGEYFLVMNFLYDYSELFLAR